MEYSSDALAQAAYVTDGYGSDVTSGETYTESKYDTSASSNLYDGNVSTYWRLLSYTSSDYCKIQYASAKTIAKYTMQAADSTQTAYYWAAWTLQGSNDNSDWTNVDVVTGQSFTDSEKKIFYVDTPTSYTYYQFIAISNAQAHAFMGEIEMMEANLQCHSESTIKTQGSYSLKGVGAAQDTYGELAISFDGADEATTLTAETGQTVTFGGTAQLDTAQYKYGTSSLLLDGNSDYVTVPDSDDWAFGSGDFTIDMWVRFTGTINSYATLFDHYTDANNFFRLTSGDGATLGQLFLYIRDAGTFEVNTSSDTALVADTWIHIAIVRSGDTFKMYQAGIEVATADVSSDYSMPNLTSVFTIGFNNAIRYWNGWIDAVRITKGTALWTSAFTPPTSLYALGGSLNKTLTKTF